MPAQSEKYVLLRLALFLAGVLCSCIVPALHAQTGSIDWFTVDGGGGVCTGGVYGVNSTIGQADAGEPMTNGLYALTGGYWALPVAMPRASAE